MKSWCASLPVVTVERSSVPKPVTLIVPYYENPQFFAEQLQGWRQMPGVGRLAYFSINVVDDGSPFYPAERVVRELGLPLVPGLRLFRIDRDVRWNWLAARNIGAHEADTRWLLLTDMDHVVSPEVMEACIYGVHRIDTIYGFSRVEHTGEPIEPHKNSWFMTKEMFWKVGGYDEAFSGLYGTDGDWRRRCAATAKMAILSDTLVRHEFVGDSSTTRYKRKQPEDAAIKQIIAQRGKDWRPKVLSFSYHDVTTAQEVA
jgi:hypothetical protein